MPKTLFISLGMMVAVIFVGALWANGPFSPSPVGTKADLLVVSKGDRQLLAYSHGVLLRSYRVSLGREPVGTKIRQGDWRTPEGEKVFFESIVEVPSDAERVPNTGFSFFSMDT